MHNGLCNLFEIFSFIFNNKRILKEGTWGADKPFMRLFSDDLHDYVCELLKRDDGENYVVKCKTGAMGRWSYTPYCVILSSKYNINYSPSSGMYPAYLISIDNEEIYLTYMLGVGSRYERTLRRVADAIVQSFPLEGFSTDYKSLNFGKDIHKYAFAVVWYKRYTSSSLPSEEVLEFDFNKVMKYHREFGEDIYGIVKNN